MTTKPNLLIVWHAALFPSYRKPFWLLQQEYGWNVHLLTSKSWRQALPEYTRFQRAPEEPISLYVHRAWFKFHGAFHVQPSFPWLFSRIQPDAVFAIEEPFSFMGWLSAYWPQRCVPRIPLILYSYQDIYKRYPPPFQWMENYVLRHADRIMVSSALGGMVLQQKEYRGLWDVLPTAVNLERFTYRRPHFQNPLFTLGYVGRLTDEKGIEDLLWSLVDLDDAVRLRLVGDGPARHRLEVRARELGVRERIAFINPVSHEDLPALYHDFDALVLPSRTTPCWREQFGRVLVEAMACGVPVIGSDSGAIPEVIGDAGLIFPEGNSAALEDKILMLLRDQKLRADLSLRGRVRVEHQFSAECVARRLHQHLSEVCDHARPA